MPRQSQCGMGALWAVAVLQRGGHIGDDGLYPACMERCARIAAGLVCVFVGLSIPLWFVGSIDWSSGPRSSAQLFVLGAGYRCGGLALVLAVFGLRQWLRNRRIASSSL